MFFCGSKNIKQILPKILKKIHLELDLNKRVVIDIPAGSGESSDLLSRWGAKVLPFDLFPEFFKVQNLKCQKADLNKSIPVESEYADMVLMQEGIEHLPHQLQALRECNRVLKPNGRLLITTPNYSNLRSRLSYLLNESEYYKFMPPNEVDSIWICRQENFDLYLGHIYSIGIQRLRTLARLSGFSLHLIHSSRVNWTSLLLAPLFLPFIFLGSIKAYRRALRNLKKATSPHINPLEKPTILAFKKSVYREVFKCGLHPDVLFSGHLIVEFKKESHFSSVGQLLHSRIGSFDQTT